jgi:hypothetical protein
MILVILSLPSKLLDNFTQDANVRGDTVAETVEYNEGSGFLFGADALFGLAIVFGGVAVIARCRVFLLNASKSS